MEPVRVRGMEIGCGIPEICVPIAEVTAEEILQAGMNIVKTNGVNIVEWRADWYKDVSDFAKTTEILRNLRGILVDKALLFTFRTSEEGGRKSLGLEEYEELNERAVQSGYVDLIDVEMRAGDESVESIVELAHRNGVSVMASSHDFRKTPPKADIVERLCAMHSLGADIAKVAVMPANKKDVITLLEASEEMLSEYAHKPIVVISMGTPGAISRICAETFGSAITFANVGTPSAPGQIAACQMREILDLVHAACTSHTE